MASITYEALQKILKLMEENNLYSLDRLPGKLCFSFYKEGENESNISGEYDTLKDEITFNK